MFVHTETEIRRRKEAKERSNKGIETTDGRQDKSVYKRESIDSPLEQLYKGQGWVVSLRV